MKKISLCLNCLPVCLLLILSQYLQAQSNVPYPYCFPTAVNMTSGNCTSFNGKKYYITELDIHNNNGDRIYNTGSTCYGSGNTDVYRYWNDTIKLYKGFSYEFMTVSPLNTLNDTATVGIWIDLNLDSVFSSNELIGSSTVSKGSFYKLHYINYTIGCNSQSLHTRIRIRVQNTSSLSGNDACSSPTGVGETWDFNLSIENPPAPKTCFQSFSNNEFFTQMPLKFYNCSPNKFQSYSWSVNNDTPTSKSQYTFAAQFNKYGNNCIKLVANNCLGKDSLVKCFLIDTVTGPPVIDFNVCDRLIEQYEFLQFYQYNKSVTYSKGVTSCQWEIYDSTEFNSTGKVKDVNSNDLFISNGDLKSKEVEIGFNTEGLYTVRLTATNPKGSTTIVKKDYAKFNPWYSQDIYLNYVGNSFYSEINSGFIDNFPDDTISQYTGNTKSKFIVRSKDKQAINFKFNRIDLADVYDSVILYNDTVANSSKIFAILNSNDNGAKISVKSSVSKVLVRFVSNATGNANGVHCTYFTDGNELNLTQNFQLGHTADPVTNFKTSFYNINQNYYSKNAYLRWFVDGIEQKSFEQNDTLNFYFKDTGSHTVKLEAKTCDSTFICLSQVNVLEGKGINGRLFLDNNNNCAYDNSETPLTQVPVRLYNAGQQLISIDYTDATGKFRFQVDTGQYRISVDTTHVSYTSLTSCHRQDTTVTLNSGTPFKYLDFDLKCRKAFDMAILSALNPKGAIRNRQFPLEILVGDRIRKQSNACNNDTFGGVFKITLPTNVRFDSATLGSRKPSVNGHELTYQVQDFSKLKFKDNFSMNLFSLSGDTLKIQAVIKTYRQDPDTGNNRKTFYLPIKNPYDPNYKEVYPEQVDESYDDLLTYTIHFQNTGNAAARDVVLIDTLDSRLDNESFCQFVASHDFDVRIDEGVLKVEFKNIELPDSFSSREGSKGFFQFKIKTKQKLTRDEYLDNFVDIYFDRNSPVRTQNARVVCRRDNYIVIPDPELVKYLNRKYPACMNGNRMDTTCTDIRQSKQEDIRGLGVKSIFGLQFFYSMQRFNCSENQIDSLYDLPSGLKTLVCRSNRIKSVGYFQNLDSLDLGDNLLPQLPALNAQLSHLWVDSNLLTQVNGLPASAVLLNCSHNLIIELPLLPAGLKILDCSDNAIKCFHKFDDQMSSLKINGNPNKCIPNRIAAMDTASKKQTLCLNNDPLSNPDECEGTDKEGIDGISRTEIKIYPNPAQEFVTIETTKESTYELMDLYGHLLKKGVTNSGKTDLDLGEFSQGIYFLRVDGQVFTVIRCLE